MCGRYAIEFEDEINEFKQIIDEINRRYNNTEVHAQMKTGEIFPSNTVPILASNDPQPFLMNWGFPRWDGKGVIINARAETAMKKKLFRSSLLTRRCVIPSTGFYEWSHSSPGNEPTLFNYLDASDSPAQIPKGKYLLRIPESSMLYMAGFYNSDLTKDRESVPAFVILTTDANKWVAPLHDRMPIIIDKKEIPHWISDEHAAVEILSRPCTMSLSAHLV
jgi:putative SOS response-associated peptidase YedK